METYTKTFTITEKLRETGKKAGEANRGKFLSTEHKEKLKKAQHARRERERLEKEEKIASGELVPFSRPKRILKPKPDPNAPKRPRGRPKKESGGANTGKHRGDS